MQIQDGEFDDDESEEDENENNAVPNANNLNLDDSVIDDSDQSCPICLNIWACSGNHQICCLKCGHLFGYRCILRWLQTSSRCPQCNTKSSVKHIRLLYAKKLASTDNSELERLKNEVDNVASERNQIKMKILQSATRLQMYKQNLSYFRTRLIELEKQQINTNIHMNQDTSSTSTAKFNIKQSIDICKSGGCRVLDYNPWYRCLVVSQKTENVSPPTYGIKKIDPENIYAQQFILLHNQTIRDVTFHSTQNELLLSVGFDKCAKLMDIQSNTITHKYETGFPLWSCCWSGDNPNAFLIGAQNGSIIRFDIRQTSTPTDTLISPIDCNNGPVVSLATLPPNPDSGIDKGGFITCYSKACYLYEAKDSDYLAKQIFFDGPFTSVRYDKKNNRALISTRPNEEELFARHISCTVRKVKQEYDYEIFRIFYAGNSQLFLSRPCHICMDSDTLIAAYQETRKSISLWSMKTGDELQMLPIDPSDPVMDLCSFSIQHELLFASLSSNKLTLYNYTTNL